MKRGQTPSQTVGPYFAYGLAAPQYGYPYTAIASDRVADEFVPGEHIRIVGRVIDGAGNPIPDALIEIWQADSEGRYAHPNDGRPSNQRFRGFGRHGTGTDPENRFIFNTVKPGRVDDKQAPHINVIVTMRGMLLHAYTRIYFSDEADANARDPVLQSVPAERRRTLIAERDETPGGVVYHIEIHMQGEEETVFFDV
ncbi:MAG: protocatechuate 3,4-dioxygenase subunit alpha [Propylenella sp.]